MSNEERSAAAENRLTPILPPGWELVDWSRRRGVVTVRAKREDGRGATVAIDTLPMLYQTDSLQWFKQVLDLELLWAVS